MQFRYTSILAICLLFVLSVVAACGAPPGTDPTATPEPTPTQQTYAYEEAFDPDLYMPHPGHDHHETLAAFSTRLGLEGEDSVLAMRLLATLPDVREEGFLPNDLVASSDVVLAAGQATLPIAVTAGLSDLSVQLMDGSPVLTGGLTGVLTFPDGVSTEVTIALVALPDLGKAQFNTTVYAHEGNGPLSIVFGKVEEMPEIMEFLRGGNGVRFDGTAYLDSASHQLDGPTTDVVLTLDDAGLDGRRVELAGEVSYDGTTRPFHIEGVFYQAGLGRAPDKVAQAEDRTGHFRVLHVGLRQEPSFQLPATWQVPGTLDDFYKTPMLSVYLMPVDSREVIFVDGPVTAPWLSDALLPAMDLELERGEMGQDHWYSWVQFHLRQD